MTTKSKTDATTLDVEPVSEETTINATTLDVEPVSEETTINATTLDVEPESQVIYLGPSLRAGRLLQSTVFRGGIPAYLQPLIDEQPDIAALIVSVDEINNVQARIVQTGTAEYVAYQAILQGGL